MTNLINNDDSDYSLFQYNTENKQAVSLHYHNAYEFIRVDDGELDVLIDGASYHVNKQQAIFIHALQIHKIDISTTAKFTIITFLPELVSEFDATYKNKTIVNPLFDWPNPIDIEKFTSPYAERAFTFDLLNKLIQHAPFEIEHTNKKREVIHKIIDYVLHHFGEKCSLKVIQEKLGYDYNYLSKSFLNLTGIRFNEYLNKFRIKKACEYLLETTLTINQIGRICGFQSIRSFNRNFTSIMDQTPSAYRQNKLNY